MQTLWDWKCGNRCFEIRILSVRLQAVRITNHIFGPHDITIKRHCYKVALCPNNGHGKKAIQRRQVFNVDVMGIVPTSLCYLRRVFVEIRIALYVKAQNRYAFYFFPCTVFAQSPGNASCDVSGPLCYVESRCAHSYIEITISGYRVILELLGFFKVGVRSLSC